MANPLRTPPHHPRHSSDNPPSHRRGPQHTNPPYTPQARPVPRLRGPPPPFATPQQEEVANRWTSPLEDPATFTPPAKPPSPPSAPTTPPFTTSGSGTPPTAASPTAPTSTPTHPDRSSEPGPCTPPAASTRSEHQAPEVNITVRRRGHEFFDPEQKRRECREKDVSSKEAAAKWAAAKQAEKETAETEAAEAATRVGRVESEEVDEGGEVGVQESGEAGEDVQEGEDTVGEMRAVERVWGNVEFVRMMRDRFPEVRGRLEARGQAGEQSEVDAPGATGGGGGRARRAQTGRGRGGNRA